MKTQLMKTQLTKNRLTMIALFAASVVATHPAMALNPQPLPPIASRHGFLQAFLHFFAALRIF